MIYVNWVSSCMLVCMGDHGDTRSKWSPAYRLPVVGSSIPYSSHYID